MTNFPELKEIVGGDSHSYLIIIIIIGVVVVAIMGFFLIRACLAAMQQRDQVYDESVKYRYKMEEEAKKAAEKIRKSEAKDKAATEAKSGPSENTSCCRCCKHGGRECARIVKRSKRHTVNSGSSVQPASPAVPAPAPAPARKAIENKQQLVVVEKGRQVPAPVPVPPIPVPASSLFRRNDTCGENEEVKTPMSG